MDAGLQNKQMREAVACSLVYVLLYVYICVYVCMGVWVDASGRLGYSAPASESSP